MVDSAISWMRIIIGLCAMALGVAVFTLINLVLLPSRVARIKACNYFGKTVSRFMVFLSGCNLVVEGAEHLDADRPAIYASNHTSIMDIFLASWLSPVGTVGVAKKEVIYYPFFGQLYLLSGHLRLDRSSSSRAVRSLRQLATLVREKGLSVFIWPEGTRSRDGRLQPLKKGLVHLAVQTGLPIVPMVVSGAHEAWGKSSLRLRPVDITVTVLPPIDTSDWDLDHMPEALSQVTTAFEQTLPPQQRPKDSAEAA